MQYVSTRGGSPALMSAEAIKMGLAPDGGLFVPVEAVRVSPDELASFPTLSYQELAVRILSRFLTDYGEAELQACVAAAYGPDRFENGDVAPLVKLSNGLHVMELWHGPTCAFKDVALQILPQFMTRAMRMTGEDRDIVILVATSGDTGKAALEGFADVEGTRMAVFFPSKGSARSKSADAHPDRRQCPRCGRGGQFRRHPDRCEAYLFRRRARRTDDAQGLAFSSANSINWGRLVPQIVYYFSAYASLCKTGDIRCGDPVNFAVPTGNFGNILAAWYARAMGLPVGKLICASNDNNVLSDFLNTGIYDRNRPFHKTASPSMDILISSNLERLLFELSGRDAAQVTAWMASLGQTGRYDVGEAMKSEIGNLFHGDWADGQATRQAIVDAWQSWGYVPDTHTAVALDVWKRYAQSTGDTTPTVIASTASPFKFSDHVVSALFGPEALKGKDEFALLELLAEKTGWPVPKGLQSLKTRPVLHKLHCEADRMRQTVMDLLALNEEGGAHA
jgi:threonine synthase